MVRQAEPLSHVGCQGAVEGLTNRLVEDGVLPGPECRGRGTGASEQELAAAASSQSATNPRQVETADAAPRSLYVSRKVINAVDKAQGFETTFAGGRPARDDCPQPDAYWMAMGPAWDDEVRIPRGGPPLMERFGVLFASNMSWDWAEHNCISSLTTMMLPSDRRTLSGRDPARTGGV
jgi:uncharacterized protein